MLSYGGMKRFRAVKLIFLAVILGAVMHLASYADTVVGATPALSGPVVVPDSAGSTSGKTGSAGTGSTSQTSKASASFPYQITLDITEVNRLCYAGHLYAGGIFYADGFMTVPETTFTVSTTSVYNDDTDSVLTGELTLIYENSSNTGCTSEVVKKYSAGDLKPGQTYSFFSESAVKNLTQRKKLYSTDLSSIKLTLNCGKKKKTYLFYISDKNEYNEKLEKQRMEGMATQ